MGSRKSREEGGVDVQQMWCPSRYEVRREKTHVATEKNQFNAFRLQGFVDSDFVLSPAFASIFELR
tara:strand:+ start:2329 stop:2526 length:198 start_codon:yes stop_codon:yes gene_type:complete